MNSLFDEYRWWYTRKDHWSRNYEATPTPAHISPGYIHGKYLKTINGRKPWKEYAHRYWMLCLRMEGRRWPHE